ncbi:MULTISPECIES: YfcC family protein [Terrabacteria group]|uniref:YfcC family protein n=1 Tax=Bacillati TaxID=1783272 RepID=UPI001939C7DD|nr:MULTISPECIES: YfcC family protein [Terrabacteria group]MBW9212120.1 YfcC family protein [Trueperella sp. zg.1013]QRG87075.1 YfcC family protein [Bulleidia sp. zg-1006]
MSTKKKRSLGTFSILLIVLLFVYAISWIFNGKPYVGQGEAGKTVEMVVQHATVGQLVKAPIEGFLDAGEVIGFVFCLGGFLALVTATGALETGIRALVRKLHGKENVMIAILMAVFALGGTTYGMCEETVGFYVLLASTMLAAGMDPMVGVATVLLGAGVGCLGSTVNPFAVTVAVDAAKAAGAEADMSKIIMIGLVLVIVTYLIATFTVIKYANKVKADKGKSIFTGEELAEFEAKYNAGKETSDERLTGRQKAVLWVFALTFVVMIFGFIPWGDLNDSVYKAMEWSKFLTGEQLGAWYFKDAAVWFTLMGFIIGFIGIEDRSKLSSIFLSGVGDMISVNLVIALARASSVIMSKTGVGPYLVQASVKAMQAAKVSGGIFGSLDYLLHLGLSFLVPSSSGMAGISSPIVPPIAKAMGFSVEATIMAEVAANGVINLITPTSGAIMGGLALASVPYATWVKWSWKTVVVIAVVSGVVITAAMLLL